MALAGQTLVTLVGDHIVGKAHQRHHAPQKDVDLFVIRKAFQHTGADQAVVCVVEHDICAQGVHHMIKALGGEPLEEGVSVPAAAHTVHHLGTVQILFHHLVHGVDIVLTVAVDGDGDIAAVAVQRLHQPRQHGVLVAAVAALGNADIVLVLCGKALDQFPRFVAGAIVDKEHPAFIADQPLCGQTVDLFQKHGCCNGQHLLLVVAGDHDPEYGLGHCFIAPY